MRIQVDLDLCQGHGMCQLEAPEYFEPQRDSVLLLIEKPEVADYDRILRAVKYCPTGALMIVEEN